MSISYDYHEDADILEVFFTEAEATASVNLTQDIILHFKAEDEQAVSLIFNNFSDLVRPDEYGPRTFRLQPEHWPESLRSIVWHILANPPVSGWLEITSYRPPRVQHSIPLATVRERHVLTQAT